VNRAVFLDRDGTIIEEKDYLHRPEDVVVFPGVGPALKRLQDAGFKLFIVTNQSGVGRCLFPIEDVHRVHEHLCRELAKDGVRIDKIYIAPEHPDVPSRARKPSPQFLFDARDEFGIDLAQSYMIGDKLIDLECGWNAGAKSILVRTGYGRNLEATGVTASAVVVDDLPAATEWILNSAQQMNIIGIIPARYASTRFPAKPLALIAGQPLIQRVVEQCQKAKSLREVIVATDDERIAEVARRFCRVEMTRSDHPSGSDRIAEVAARVECDAMVNIQGDEPLIDPQVIDAVAGALKDNEMSTAATAIRRVAEYESPNVVKVVVSASGRALYFSRRTIPFVRDAASRSSAEQLAAFPFLKHLGIYGYQRETLLRLVTFPVSPLESAEKLEQLRALENGIQIAVVRVNYDSVGVDAPEDIERVEALLRERRE